MGVSDHRLVAVHGVVGTTRDGLKNCTNLLSIDKVRAHSVEGSCVSIDLFGCGLGRD